MATIRLRIGDSTGALDDAHPHWVIGRDEATADLFAGDATVSRRHCEVFLHAGCAYIRDMGSSNGTWVNGHLVDRQGVELAPGQQVFVGHMPLSVEWSGSQNGATVMGALPPELAALIQARKQQAAVQYAQQPVKDAGPAELTYRRQGSNNNGVLLIALPGDRFANEGVIRGFAEFIATDNETINDISIELIEYHRRGSRRGHVWDRVIIKQGPWKCRANDRVPSPFELRIPAAAAMSNPSCHWEVEGSVDIAWAYDVEVSVPIEVDNQDVEKIRDAMGLLDLRVKELESKPKGQHFLASFEPPAQWRNQWNIDQVNLEIQYMGTNLQLLVEVDKRGIFSHDRRTTFVVDLGQLRASKKEDVSRQLQETIHRMLSLQ